MTDYRYQLTRDLRPGALIPGKNGKAVFIMLNPSTATETEDDPTIRKCMGFARRADCALLVVVNLYARRATEPAKLPFFDDPVGPENDAWIRDSVAGADRVIAAWGNFPYERMPGGRDRVEHVLGLISGRHRGLYCVARSKAGFPMHPLYVPYGELKEWP